MQRLPMGQPISCGVFVLLGLLACHGTYAADALSKSLDTSIDNTRQEAAVQHTIEKIDDDTESMLAEYQRLSRELDVSTAYHDQLQRLVASQDAEKGSITQQMDELDATQREIVPLMLHMIDGLAELVDADLPFLGAERRQRVAQLRDLMDRADVTLGEKYRRLLEAYQIELDYGRTIEAYRGDLVDGGAPRAVDFLRVGRIGLYYQSLDRSEIGHWDAERDAWARLPDAYRRTIRRGLQIANNQAAPELLRLPVPAPQILEVAR